MLSVAVIVVNYGTPELAISAVDSVLTRTHGGRDVSVHLVDNASPGGDAGILAAAHADRGWGDRVTLYLEPENHGFGRGNNLVIDRLLGVQDGPDAFFLLNPDAQLENEALAILAERMEADPAIGFAGAGISHPGGTARVAAFRFPSYGSELSKAMVGPLSGRLQRWKVAMGADTPDSDVDWVAGAAFLIRADVLRQVGSFDPDFFLYYEEVELMWRGAAAGWRCRYIPSARVIHVEGAATDVKSDRQDAKRHPPYRYQSWWFFYYKTRGRFGALAMAFARIFGVLPGFLLARLRGQKPNVPAYFFQDFWSYSVRPLLRGETPAARSP